jgi:hypothetical protein
MVMVKCPQTGRAIPTGIEIDRESFRRSTVFFKRTRCPICRADHHWFARDAWVDEPNAIAMERHMARMQVSPETSDWLLQAQDLLDEARRLRPGQARDELRQVAKAMRELAKLDAQSEAAPDLDRPERR